MSQLDFKLEIKGKVYFARFSNTSGLFWSPLFTSMADFEKWLGFKTKGELELFVLHQKDFDQVQDGVKKLLAGIKPGADQRAIVRKFNQLSNGLKDLSYDQNLVNQKALELKADPIFETQLKNNIDDLIYYVVRTEEFADKPGLLKLAGYFLDAQFRQLGIFEKDFAQVYQENVKAHEKNE